MSITLDGEFISYILDGLINHYYTYKEILYSLCEKNINKTKDIKLKNYMTLTNNVFH